MRVYLEYDALEQMIATMRQNAAEVAGVVAHIEALVANLNLRLASPDLDPRQQMQVRYMRDQLQEALERDGQPLVGLLQTQTKELAEVLKTFQDAASGHPLS